MKSHRSVYFLSDHTGVTAQMVGRGLLSRFEGITFTFHIRPFISSAERLQVIIDELNQASAQDGAPAIAFCTITDIQFTTRLQQANALVINLFEPYLTQLELTLKTPPSNNVGMFHSVQGLRGYQQRIGAIDFALATDDGLGAKHYSEASVIVLAVSRAGKTPTCLYLAMQHHMYAANYPLTEDDMEKQGLPPTLQPYQDRLFGLTIDPKRLQQIRQTRRPKSRYASLEQCELEVRWSLKLFERYNIPFENSTASSIEEIASRVLQQTRLRAANKL